MKYFYYLSFIFVLYVFPRLILEFDLRTKEGSGLLLYMARINHADFVSIQVSSHCISFQICHLFSLPSFLSVFETVERLILFVCLTQDILTMSFLHVPIDQRGTSLSGIRSRQRKYIWLRPLLHQWWELAQGGAVHCSSTHSLLDSSIHDRIIGYLRVCVVKLLKPYQI